MTANRDEMRLDGAARLGATFAAALLMAGALVATFIAQVVSAFQCDEAGPDCTATAMSVAQSWVAIAGLLPALGCVVAAGLGRGRAAGRWAGLAALVYVLWGILVVHA